MSFWTFLDRNMGDLVLMVLAAAILGSVVAHEGVGVGPGCSLQIGTQPTATVDAGGP